MGGAPPLSPHRDPLEVAASCFCPFMLITARYIDCVMPHSVQVHESSRLLLARDGAVGAADGAGAVRRA